MWLKGDAAHVVRARLRACSAVSPDGCEVRDAEGPQEPAEELQRGASEGCGPHRAEGGQECQSERLGEGLDPDHIP